ncbi:hypothetical protein KC960_00295 [Candidatus Saccharibacteria bacterium]|nr:hypothetical protein [Candidatus Saccharibacteria bacterium]
MALNDQAISPDNFGEKLDDSIEALDGLLRATIAYDIGCMIINNHKLAEFGVVSGLGIAAVNIAARGVRSIRRLFSNSPN